MLKTAYIIVDLGFGDAGKGSIIDYLAHTREISAIIRYTGGPHAAHHVVRPDGVSHAFSQFGATFQPGVRSHLARGVIVKPENLIYEGQALEEKGVSSPFARLSIHPLCRVVTAYHAMLCQMKEAARGDHRRGTVGIGVGEAVAESEAFPEQALRVIDLFEPDSLRDKLGLHFEHMQRQAQDLLRDCTLSPYQAEIRAIYDSFMRQVRLKDLLALYRHFTERLNIPLWMDQTLMNHCAHRPGDLLLEGAHAALLDRERGYYPFVAKTDTTTQEAHRVLEEAQFSGTTRVIGAARAFGYRHGPGPFVSEDPRLTGLFEERHNKANEWQGQVRYGWFDLLAIRHGLRLNRRVDALALTMLDHLERVETFQVCRSYEYRGPERQRLDAYFEHEITPNGRVKITAIKPVPTRRDDELARLLFDCVPCDWQVFADPRRRQEDFIRFLESPDGLGLPVQILSSGPTVADKTERRGDAA